MIDLEVTDFEQNAHQRAATPHKILGKGYYRGHSPGHLGLKVYYGGGCLTVHLGKAKLFGKRSQDPYAIVYLVDEATKKCYFQRDNRQTDVFDQNIEPNFNKTFYFKMDMLQISSKDLIIAIWDRDSHSKDDYMAGIRLSLADVRDFEKREINIELLHQEIDGHPALLTGNVEERFEQKAMHRAKQPHKIKGESTFSNGRHGKLKLKIDYIWGFLHVHLYNANLNAKSSQDPFAMVYLLDEDTNMSTHQINNSRTNTFDRNINPDFSHDFFFRMKSYEIQRRKLVIAIWDDDSGKSHDDFMEGIRINMVDFAYFEKLGKSVEVTLKHQANDGHPALMSYDEINAVFKIVRPTAPTEHSMDLQSCNDNLITLIEKARVLSEASEVKQSYPSILHEQTSIRINAAEQLLNSEIVRLQGQISSRKTNLTKSQLTLDQLKNKNKENYNLTASNQQILFDLEQKLFKLQSFQRSTVSVPLKLKEEKLESIDTVDLGRVVKERKLMEKKVKIRTEYQDMLKSEMITVRNQYRLQYKQFMDEFQKIINQVLSDYEQLVKARASGYPEQKLKMLELQKKRMYEKRILDLSNQIENLQQNYRTLSAKLNGLANKYNPKMHMLDDELKNYKENMRRLLNMMVSHVTNEYDKTIEIAIFGHLLVNEESRMAGDKFTTKSKKVSVRKSVTNKNLESVSSQGTRNESQYQMNRGYSSRMSQSQSSSNVSENIVKRRSDFFDKLIMDDTGASRY